MATPTTIEILPPSAPERSEKTLDVISKLVAAFAILLYGCGFLITSIYHASYGFLESDPLRPRIVFAGAWFMIFLVTPVFLVGRFLREEHWNRSDPWWLKLRAFFFDFYTGVAAAATLVFNKFFEFDPDAPVKETVHEATDTWWSFSTTKLVVLGILVLVLLAVASSLYKRHIPEKWRIRLGAIYWIGLVLWILWSGYHELYDKGHFSYSAVVFWFLAVGIASCLQRNVFRSTISPNDVPVLGLSLLTAVTSFATLYYPHIKSSWGGGVPVKATIYFTKDSPILPLQSAYVSRIDESSLGLYVVGQKDRQATFIPRSSVAFIYFSGNGTGFFVPSPNK